MAVCMVVAAVAREVVVTVDVVLVAACTTKATTIIIADTAVREDLRSTDRGGTIPITITVHNNIVGCSRCCYGTFGCDDGGNGGENRPSSRIMNTLVVMRWYRDCNRLCWRNNDEWIVYRDSISVNDRNNITLADPSIVIIGVSVSVSDSAYHHFVFEGCVRYYNTK